MLRLFFTGAYLYLLTVATAFGETLLSGAVFFDSENTLLEVKKLIQNNDQVGLVRLFDGNHISQKIPQDTVIILFTVGTEPESPAEFRFPLNPTTYWTFSRYVRASSLAANVNPAPSPVSSPSPSPTPVASVQELLGGGDSLSPTPTPVPEISPFSSPTPRPKPTPTPVDPPLPSPSPSPPSPALTPTSSNTAETSRTVRRRHRRLPAKGEEDGEVPESAKVWHKVDGKWKWYDKRNWHEIRRAEPVVKASPTPSVR